MTTYTFRPSCRCSTTNAHKIASLLLDSMMVTGYDCDDMRVISQGTDLADIVWVRGNRRDIVASVESINQDTYIVNFVWEFEEGKTFFDIDLRGRWSDSEGTEINTTGQLINDYHW